MTKSWFFGREDQAAYRPFLSTRLVRAGETMAFFDQDELIFAKPGPNTGRIYGEGRRCPRCKRLLAQLNPGPLCFPCQFSTS
jgi:hypothetical protein